MFLRVSAVLALGSLLLVPTFAKNKKKSLLPGYILQARTVRIVIDPDAGEPLDQPRANYMARENVEKALTQWGRFDILMDGQESDLVIMVRTGDGKAMRPTIRGGAIDRRPGWGQGTDSSTRIGGQQGQAPPLNDPSMNPPNNGPHISNEVGPFEDTFEVYQGNVQHPLDSSPGWRYIAKDCLRAPQVTAVEEFRKAIAEAEKPNVNSKKSNP